MHPKLPGRSPRGSKSHSRRSNRRDPKRHRRDFRLGLQALEDRLALTALPTGFTETPFTSGFTLSSPTAIAFSPTGQMWSLEQGGRVRFIRSDGTTPATPAKTLTVDSSGERGLLGIAFDPNYDGAGPNLDFVYLYYTVPRVVGANPPDPSNNQISRFPVLNAGSNAPSLGDPDITRELPPEDEDNNLTTDGDTNHNGGGLHFGLDGKLYISVGDHNYDPPANQQASSPAQRLDIPFGKVLRLNTNLTNPTDNPAYDGSASDWPGAIYAMGFRNPFRFAVQPGTGTIFVNDVGEGTWEEIDKLVPSDQPGPVADYGWAGSNGPAWEGFEPNPATPTVPWANYHNPEMAYRHDSTTPGSTAITGGVFYPVGGSFGSAYAGKYFYSDLNGGYIRVFDPANPGTYDPANPNNPALTHPDTSSEFATNLTGSNPIDLTVDSVGNLYYVAAGTGVIYKISTTSAVVASRQLFYNESKFDGSKAINSSDNFAIATDKSAYLPDGTTATFANVSSYSRGINGIMVDLSGTGTHASINAGDFVFKVGNNNTPSSWTAGPIPTAISVRMGAGVGGSDRVEVTWATGAIKNAWLEVQVLPSTRTGLSSADIFFFGNKIGDSGTDGLPNTFETNSTDAAQVFATLGTATVTNLRDYNRSGRVDSTDAAIVFATLGSINRLQVGPAGPFAPEGGGDGAAEQQGIASGLAAGRTATSESSAGRVSDDVDRGTRRTDVNRGVLAAYFHQLENDATRVKRELKQRGESERDTLLSDEGWLDALVADLRV